MKAIPYVNKKKEAQFKPQVSHHQMEQIMIGCDSVGWCLHCGDTVDGVEPDAKRYVCEVCNLPKVFGMEELMMMGLVVIK